MSLNKERGNSLIRSLHLGNVRPHLQTFGGGSIGEFLDSGNIMNSGLLPARLDLFSTPTRGRSNTNGSVHSIVPETSINYELFSLKRIMSLSTGTYPVSQSTHNSNDYLIDTAQWEEISMSQSYWNKYIMKEKKSADFLDYDKASSNDSLGNPSNLDTSSISSSTNGSSQNVGDDFFTNAIKQNATSASPRKRPTSENYSKDISNVSKPVTFKNVISGGSSTLYNVIACLCSNNVIVLRFFGTVKYIERDDEKHKHGKYNDEDEMSETESVASVGSVNNMGGANLRMEDEDYSNNRLCSPIVRCLSYFQENEIDIETISMEESARWLSCITAEGDVYIVPICRLFFPYNLDNSYPFKKNQDDSNGGINLHPSLMDYTLYQVDTPSENNSQNNQFTEALSLNLMKNMELVVANSSSSLKKHQQVQKYYQQHLLQTQSLLEPIERIVMTSNTRTKRQYTPLKHGQVTCSAWWVSFSNHPLKKYYVIFGTDRGFLVF
ncbi:predicted protein [Naegleria gruberi]|uniref:Predicted protein n=1 Tax=Naegleria gruberi TaxID=5762 RepID=D2UX59_NAEGR|nr:uncharacterized protein NAEGRDRAFT_61648 [Naegleria gruberi]EFC50568.1 predicted protein [Naegleria gruberi]|eukprot:XP_002683312.1 predicted protein [Naegleria gruberi strain NEG-M]